MKIKSLNLCWFRGAAESACLEINEKSVVIYGANATGKSSLPDAIEYIIRAGTIEHLRHEYSGSHQIQGIRNTHTPSDLESRIVLRLDETKSIIAEISPDGVCSFSSEPADLIHTFQSLNISQIILRQDEIARFVHATKGEKYSSLLPLLGLDEIDMIASNIHDLKNSFDKRSELIKKVTTRDNALKHIRECIGDTTAEKVEECLGNLADSYLEGKKPEDISQMISLLNGTIQSKMNSAEPIANQYSFFAQIIELEIPNKIKILFSSEKKMAEEIDALLDHKIALLEKASEYANALSDEDDEINCPVCGQRIVTKDFIHHIKSELAALAGARNIYLDAKKNRRILSEALSSLIYYLQNDALRIWLELDGQKQVKEKQIEIQSIDLTEWDRAWSEDTLSTLLDAINIIYSKIVAEMSAVPPTTIQLVQDRDILHAIIDLQNLEGLHGEIKKIQVISSILDECESVVRENITQETQRIIESISQDIESFWEILHPGELIEDIKLYIPEDSPKAIDVCLKFYGIEQPSPRLTLSEGHRNSLGLCVFLALSKLQDSVDIPIILDDVVSSFDREHRGFIADVLLHQLSDRQVVVLTHDREWFSELRNRLPARDWSFMKIRPWKNPQTGIQFSESTDTFDNAMEIVRENPEAAGTRTRATMDYHLALAAEKVKLLMPYARGDKNDHRTCVDFLRRFISEGSHRFRKKVGNEWISFPESLDQWKETLTLLIAWADRASHTGTLTHQEAIRLIDMCRRTLDFFKCPDCSDYVWQNDRPNRERLQCSCSLIQWRYD